MTALVLDASAALALLRGDAGAGEVHRLLRDQALAAEPILVPGLFWLEIVNVLAHRYRYPPDAIVEAGYELERAGVATAEAGRPGVLAVIDGIGRSGLTAYDAAYLVLAESTDARLLTADAVLASAAGDRAILIGGGSEVAESRQRYAASGSWASWKGAAGYLAELRRAL